jgi:CheY-like chemotaxis protein
MKQPTILLVEDNPGDQRLFHEAVLQTGRQIEVCTLPDGAVALQHLFKLVLTGKVARPDLIVLDINMPRLGGLVVLREIKASVPLSSIPTILLTSVQDAGETEALALADEFISKSLRVEEYLLIVRDLLSRWLPQEATRDWQRAPLAADQRIRE